MHRHFCAIHDCSIVQNTQRSISGFFHPTLFVVVTAIASLILIALSAKWQSLRRHPLSLYLSAGVAMVGLSAMWTTGMPELSMCLYIAFSFGCAFMTFYWIELLASVTAFELMVIIAGNTLATILVTLITDYLSFYEYFVSSRLRSDFFV